MKPTSSEEVPNSNGSGNGSSGANIPPGYYLYDPDTLDDPGLLHGRHRLLRKGDAATGPIISSVILFVNAKQLQVCVCVCVSPACLCSYVCVSVTVRMIILILRATSMSSSVSRTHSCPRLSHSAR